jgi:HK97 family phage major capsid protein
MADTATAVKMLDADRGRIGGYLVVWGSPEQRDTQGEFFSTRTELGLDWYDRRPVLYQHGHDGALKAEMIGTIERMQRDDLGLWVEAQLDLRQRYTRAIQELIRRGALHWSSGSLPAAVQVAGDGHIERWPIVEGSLTPTPAEPRRTGIHPLATERAGKRVTSEKKEDTMTNEFPSATRRLPLPEERRMAPPLRVSSPYDGYTAGDLLHGYMLLRGVRGFAGVSERYANALADKVRLAGMTATKADELSTSTQTGYGDEWVPDLWSSHIWAVAAEQNVVLPLFRSVEMPTTPYELPVAGEAPTVHYVPETSDEAHLTLGAGNPIPESRMGSGKVQLHARKLALRVGFSSELVEDAIVPVLKLYREETARALANAIDQALLNGDTVTTVTGNINSDHAAPPATAPYLAFDGLRKLALAGAAINMNGTPTLAKLREVRFALGARYAIRPSELAWIVDGATYAKLLGLEEFLTMDKAGAHATAQTGQLGLVDGVAVFVSAEMPQTEADGKVGASNSKGQAVCVYRPGWTVGYRRRITLSVDHIPYYDSYQLTATVRLAFAPHDSATAGVLYNITV